MSICTVKFLHFPTLHFCKKTALELLCPHETAITIIAVYDNVHFLLKRDWIYICCCSVWRSLRYTSTQTTLNVIFQYQRHRKQHMYWAGLLKNITIKSNHRIRHLFSEVLTVLSLPLLAYTQLHTTVLHTGKHKTPPLTSYSTVNLNSSRAKLVKYLKDWRPASRTEKTAL